MKKDNLNIAVYQQDIVWEDPDANFEKVEKTLASSFADGWSPDVIVVPETFTTGFGDHMAGQAEPPLGRTFEFALSQARKYDALFAGTWTVREEGGIYNRMHLVKPDGSYSTYDKAHTFRMSSEASQLVRGTRRVVCEWKGWRLKPAVCYDLRFPVWDRNSFRNGKFEYDIAIFTAEWPKKKSEVWNTLLRARAIENQAFVVGVNRVGIDDSNIEYKGESMVLNVKGRVVEQAQPGESVFTAELSEFELEAFRQYFVVAKDWD